MAITLWSVKTPGVAQYERDQAVMNNKRKVKETIHRKYNMFTKKRNDLKNTALGREPVSIIHYTRPGSYPKISSKISLPPL